MGRNKFEKKSRFIKSKIRESKAQRLNESKAAARPPISGEGEIIKYLDTILNLQCDTQGDIVGLVNKMEQIHSGAQETCARVNGIQNEVEDLSSSLGRFLRQKKAEPAPTPKEGRLLRYIGISALLAPLIWNGISAGVDALWRGTLNASGSLLMTSVVSAGWGLLLLCVEPRLD